MGPCLHRLTCESPLIAGLLTAVLSPPPRFCLLQSCANSFLLRDIAKTEWQFSGYITSDCDGGWRLEDSRDERLCFLIALRMTFFSQFV